MLPSILKSSKWVNKTRAQAYLNLTLALHHPFYFFDTRHLKLITKLISAKECLFIIFLNLSIEETAKHCQDPMNCPPTITG